MYSINSLNSVDSSYTLSYKVRNHIFGKEVYIKTKLGMNSTIPFDKPFHKEDEQTVFVDVELRVNNIFEIRFNSDNITNTLDKAIIKALEERIEYLKKTSYANSFSSHYNEVILVNVPLTMSCNYNGRGYQSDAFGFTLEFKDEATSGFYKENEYVDELKDIVEDNDIHSKEDYTKDFIFRLYRIVDNERKIGPLWVNLGGESVKIVPTYDIDKSDGIYIYSGSGSKPLKIINTDNITKELLMKHGLSKSKIDLENTPHSKIYADITKENNTLKKKNKELEENIKLNEYNSNKMIDKLHNQIFSLNMDIKERDRVIYKLKEDIKDNKEIDALVKDMIIRDHKREVERLKQNQEYNNLQNGFKLVKDGTSFIEKIFKLIWF